MKIRPFSSKMKWLAAGGLAALLIGGGVWWYRNGGYQLGGEKLSAAIEAVQAPGESSVTAEKIVPQPLYVRFSAPAAAMNVDYEQLDKAEVIRPATRGRWRWESDRLLRFMPEADWVPDTEYKVSLPAYLFNPQVKIKSRDFTFAAPLFKGRVEKAEFYEDPRDLRRKSAVASFRFTYPLDAQAVEKSISVRAVSGEKYDFTYKLTDFDTVLHVVSAPLNIKEDENFIKITVADAPNAYNKKPLSEKLTATVKVPSSSTFFKVTSLYSSIVRNEQDNDNPEQILFVDFSTAVKAAELAQKLKLYYLAKPCYEAGDLLSKAKNNPQQLADKQEVPFEAVSADSGSQKKHLLKYDLNRPDGCLIAFLPKDLQSVEGFVLGKDVVQKTALSPYPREAKIAFDGAILPRKGNKEAMFVSRGVNELRANIARINPQDLNHLATQTGGDFAHPYFRNYNFSEDNIAEIFSKTLKINTGHPAKADYSSLNLSEYLGDRKGVFLVKVRGYAGENVFSPEDSRLIVITDLGIVVKDNLDKTHGIFVSDVSAGRPVSGALVEVLGKNGLTVMRAKTNSDGYALMADFSEFKNDKEAVVYKVSKGDDVSFLPIGRGDRVLNMSRFDVGGEYSQSEKDALNGYMFTDRGIYRPGENGYVGIIVRQNDLKVPQKLPFVLEIRNTAGDVTATQNLWADAAGFMSYEFKLKPEAVTGTYWVYLYVKDKKGEQRYVSSASFKVGEFLPDTLRMKASFQGQKPKGWFAADKLTAEVMLSNLYGNPAVGHEIKALYRLMPADFSFKEFSGYVFRDPLRGADTRLRSYQENLPAAKTNAAGEAQLEVDLSRFERGTYMLRLNIDGLEAGSGRGVSEVLSSLVSPNEYLVGWKADGKLDYIHKDTRRSVKFLAVNNNLEPVEREGLLMRLNRKQYVSSLVVAANGTYRYQMVPKEQLIFAHALKIGSTGIAEDLKTDEAGEYILTIEDKDGNCLARVEYNVAGAANLSHAVDKDASLGLKLNRQEYQNGDEIEMQITAPYAGYGLITIERDSVYAYKWFKADTNSVVQRIELPDGVEGNAYVNVAFFRDVTSKEIYMPSLSYAAAPFSINKSGREIAVELGVPETVKPGEDLVITYKTSVPAKIVVYGVNQGILQVAGYKMPNPLKAFLKKKALRVVTSQIMDLIMPDIRILRLLTSSGGDSDYAQTALERNLNPFARKTDKPVAFWSGIVPADAKGGTYVYRVPETFNGEIKVMAVAVSAERFGSASTSVLSRGDFALLPSGPLNVSPGDEFVIGLSVGNLVENSGNDYGVRVSLKPGDGFEVISAAEQTLQMAENGEAMLEFRLKALSDIGAKEMLFEAESLSDASKQAKMPYTVSLRPASPYSSKFALGMARSKYKLDGVEDLYEAFRVQQLSASGSPLVLATGLLKYLDKFPHYCTEQSVSKIFAAMEVFFKYPELVKGTDVYALFDDVIGKLRSRQVLDGGFQVWEVSGLGADPYVSVYTTHFLLKAQEHGFNVPENMLKQALSYCEGQAALAPKKADDFVPAYAIYVLTLSGKVTTNYLLNLEEIYQKKYAKTWRQQLGATMMAASYEMLQDDKQARRLFGHYKYSGPDFEAAMNMYLNAVYFPQDFAELEKESIEKLLKPIEKGDFTTASAAWSVLALSAVDAAVEDKNIRFSALEPVYTPFPTVNFNPQTKDLIVHSDKPFYYAVAQQGFVVEGKLSALSEGLEVSKIYYDRDGNVVKNAHIGDELTVKVFFRGLGREAVDNVAIVDLLPGCVEVVNGSFAAEGGVTFHEVREDRVVAYVWADAEAQSFSYKAKVIAEGDFVVPAVYGSALYQPLIRAHSASGQMNVAR